MAQKKTFGTCRLCGDTKLLTFEHIPPRSAFNDNERVFTTLHDHLSGRSHTKFRRGLGTFSLCQACNNKTGALYGAAYVEWARQALGFVEQVPDAIPQMLPFEIRPLPVIKQLCVMAIAMAPESSLTYHEEIRAFVLNHESQCLPSKYRLYAYLNVDGGPRFESGMVVASFAPGTAMYIDAEVALPPTGIVVTSSRAGRNKVPPRNAPLCDITWFSEFSYNALARVNLSLAKLATHTPFPLDYRSPEEIERELLQGIVHDALQGDADA